MAEQLNEWYATKQPAQTKTEQPTGMVKTVNNWQNTPDQTVQGQVENIVKQDNPLMQMAKTQGDQESLKRGLYTSSIGIGAAQDSVYKTALPIAQTDAAQAARVAGYNVDTLNKANEYNATNTFNRQEREANNAYDFEKTQYTEGQTNTRQTENVYAGLSDTYAKGVAAINADPNMTQKAKTYAITQLYDTHKASLSMLSAVGKMSNVSDLLTPKAPAQAPRGNYRNLKTYAPAQPAGGKMICSRCYSIGLMDELTYFADDVYCELLKIERPQFIQWYWTWARYVVDAMHCKTWKSRLFTALAWLIVVSPWSRQMAKEMGFNKKGSLVGKFYMKAANGVYRLTNFIKSI